VIDPDRSLSTLELVAKGNRVFVLTGSPLKMIEATAQGQVVIAIDLEPIVEDADDGARGMVSFGIYRASSAARA
jgi:hypothetical protein